MGALRTFAKYLALTSVALNIYIYTYPSLHAQQCLWAFEPELAGDGLGSKIAEIPYLGDLYRQYVASEVASAPKRVPEIKMMAFGDPQIGGVWPQTPYIKRLDTYGNDHYLGHIYRVMKARLTPTHVAVLGDLFSSQWIGDTEFYNRTRRYISRLFPQPAEYVTDIQHWIDQHHDVDWRTYLDEKVAIPLAELEFGYEDIYQWTVPELKAFNGEPLFINLTGNHDIGYAGDATWQHMARYVKLFGKDNYWIEYDRETDHPWRIVVLNDLLLEGPALQEEFRTYTWEFLRQLGEQKFNGSTVLLTHIPFHKREGLCVDGPKHVNYPHDYEREPYKQSLLRSQNFIGFEESQKVLNTIFDNGKPGIILTGHDHEGCENWFNKLDNGTWEASKEKLGGQSVHEITVRAMMGDFGGNTGLMTGRFDESTQEWQYEFSLCPFIVQHVWWGTKVFSSDSDSRNQHERIMT
ncbi:hypothetical protein BABINDRAFT_166912 [Babjeviella inositovora NRRL Y-12698]|uniref:Calcineurin-like phosphoesterase domain-containing protein n=1 Tax=Babjeviella inositovora NRRL Y-12698 TaxID=984486 RepID=A0A1E3QQ88_9ASCO|nr:uncharacterized protein BABINDRAFT_166912 [Babjeviella inositovora NRRL Y-12698]ODQ79808.1 hypothetical protein BABINDRAFT_166912 [Babjeviella inositovora NRRL Y-12698]